MFLDSKENNNEDKDVSCKKRIREFTASESSVYSSSSSLPQHIPIQRTIQMILSNVLPRCNLTFGNNRRAPKIKNQNDSVQCTLPACDGKMLPSFTKRKRTLAEKLRCGQLGMKNLFTPCSGFLISPRHVLTAAHCALNEEQRKVEP
ncbi:hypothetical protein COOONC_19248 [Cooperia oncophora]